MKIKRPVEKIGFIVAIGMSIVALLFVVALTWIGFEVAQQCEEAKTQYKGDCVEVLMKTVENEEESLRDRNEAIWALGQIGDDRALSTLQQMYTGDIPDREPYDETISQYELRKAIKLLSGGPNITAFVWRHQLD